jgi:hypothetical protein
MKPAPTPAKMISILSYVHSRSMRQIYSSTLFRTFTAISCQPFLCHFAI